MNFRPFLLPLQEPQRPATQSLEFLIERDNPDIMRMVVTHFVSKEKLSEDSYELSNIETHLQKFMAFIIQKNTSFVLKSFDGKIIGFSLNLDIKDLLTLFETTINFSVFEGLGMFTRNMKNWVYKLADCRKGDYLFNILTVFQQHELGVGRRIDYVLRAMAFCKIIGWKSLLYPTNDPFFFLKLGGEIFYLLRNSEKFHAIQKDSFQKTGQTHDTESISLNLQPSQSNALTYVLIMRMQKLNFVYFEYDKERIGQIESSLEDSESAEPLQHNLRLCILPKL